MEYFLIIDIGTSSIRVALMDDSLNIKRLECLKRTAEVTFDAEKEWADIFLMMKKVLRQVTSIKAISVSSLLAWVGVDADRKAVTPCFTYMHQCLEQYQGWRQRYRKEELYRLSYRTLSPEAGGLALLYLKECEPEQYQRLDQFLTLKDFMNARLTEQTSMDVVSASYTMLYDLDQSCWSQDMIADCQLDPKKLPRLLLPTQKAGILSTRLQHELGLTGAVVVTCASVDGSTGILGAGGNKNGTAVSVMGTTDVFFAVQDEKYLDKKQEIITNPHVVAGTWLVGGPMGMFGGTIDWLLDHILYHSKTLEEMNTLAAKLPPGCQGLTFLPALAGERTPFWSARMQGTILGLQGQHRAEHMFRSIMEANCYTNKVIIDNLNQNNRNVHEVIAIGGGSGSDLWLQIKADILGLPVIRAAVTEASLLGACLLAMKACELAVAPKTDSIGKTIFEPDIQKRSAYQDGYQQYLDKHSTMKKFYEHE